MFMIRADGNNPLGGYGINEIVTSTRFESEEAAQEYVLDGWGECALQQVRIVDEDADDSCSCPDYLLHGHCTHTGD